MTYLNKITKEKYRIMKDKNCYWEGKIKKIASNEKLEYNNLTRFTYGGNIVFSVDGKLVIKLFPAYVNDEFIKEKAVLEHLNQQQLSVEIPKIHSTGQFEGWNYIIMTELKGTLLIDIFDILSIEEKAQIAKDLGELIKEVHSATITSDNNEQTAWNHFMNAQYENLAKHHKQNELNEHFQNQLSEYVKLETLKSSNQLVLLTGEYTPFNLIMNKENGMWKFTGLIDFADCFVGNSTYDLLGPIAFMFYPNKGLNRMFLESYGYKPEELNDGFQKELLTYLLLHRFSNISYYQQKSESAKNAQSFEELEKIIFNFEV
ncbi:aminoglycoside phosphotransferase family protein [Gottfriedia solisilvae]|uniref:Phosphotransferase n=1 Tax=Gottfriedia solisilvae TaxID=1516104 RepID=A0A8J3AIM3_9BACI|nr:aminoglycoside 3'-phosphotransferase/choline kinase family protein [Gottfriedia solisilvae]GGI15192.1 phosphotransferase [Gottfriedia solisilvae]